MKIIILHGLFMNKVIMAPLARRLEQRGYSVDNISYPSTRADKNALFDDIDARVGEGPTVLLGHSLGGLVATEYLFERKVSVNRIPLVITLGTPHQGAQIAEDMKKVNIQRLLGSSVQFGLLPKHFEKAWPLPQKLVSIAGSLNIGARPLLDRVWRDEIEQSDGTVSINETRIPGMTEHIIVKQTHTAMVYSKDVVNLIDDMCQKYVTQQEPL
ncbi:alpha/beta fold hydrolase [Thalassotalea ponticola]|uniref:alpha/beta fold hydrolase n=1 Tax=Thalassotalea ponticola TaxID=1523392 RepID=UPI0025B2F728|nr:alpha/beta fold hydrolase [Thalassotalea ponticola]MDN3653595.1 alpha/beta fold hydrolase [Thalassotalea ponticola]